MTRVLHIAGYMRSGTTLAAELAGTLSDCVALGEVTGIFSTWSQDRPCSCGEPVSVCPVWGPALERLTRRFGIDRDAAAATHQFLYDVSGVRNMPKFRRSLRSAHRSPDVARYLAIYRELFDGLAEATAGGVLVDSSKTPPLLPGALYIEDLDLTVVHVLRDPRGVAYSEVRTRGVDPATGFPPGRGAAASAAYWSAFNLMVWHDAGRMPSYRTLDYRAMATSPGEAVNAIGRLIGSQDALHAAGVPITLAQSHICAGNPNRFGPRDRHVAVDDSWTDGMRLRDKALASVISAPAALALSVARHRRPLLGKPRR